MKLSKKGSMQLGIEAIIILIIAIVLLGTIIYFVKNAIGDAGDTIGGEIKKLKNRCDADSASPVVPVDYDLKQGKTQDLQMCVFNNEGVTIKEAKIWLMKCLKPDLTELDKTASRSKIKIGAIGSDLQRDESYQYIPKVNTEAVTETELGSWTCTIQISKTDAAISDTNPGIGPISVTLQMT